MESPSTLYPKKVDLTNCDKEPIHSIDTIQDHGFLLAFDLQTKAITFYSENCIELFDIETATITSTTLYDLFAEETVTHVLAAIDQEKKSPLHLSLHDHNYILIAHHNGDHGILELEPTGKHIDPIQYQEQLSTVITKLNLATDELSMCDAAAQLIKDFFGYDRVMIYQFDAQWNGKVVSEIREPELESWLGLHYPASDIPQQARKLFLKQGVRIISDVASQPKRIIKNTASASPLDVSRSELRAVSPIHIEYLTNMGVSATLTAAIVFQDQLWGLVACHNYSPKFINYHRRVSCKFITQVFSTQLGLQSTNSLLQKTNESNKVRSRLIEKMSQNWDIDTIISDDHYSILDIADAEGAALCLNQQIKTIGNTPSNQEIQQLIDWLIEKSETDIYTTNHLSGEYNNGKDIIKEASGVLAVFLSKSKRNILLWFKPEIIQTVDWGGNPHKAVTVDNERLSPRKSFAKWSIEHTGHSAPWHDYEIAAAKALKDHIAEIIIQKYDEINTLNQKLKSAYNELESFSYSVSHDLRAPLRGIDGFAQIIKEDYYETLDDFGKQAVRTIISSIDKMNLLIDDILAFSSLGKTSLKKEELSMYNVVDEVLEFLQVDVFYTNFQIQIQDLPHDYGDRVMIFQLFNNLIGNALKYSSKVKHPEITIGHEHGVYFVKDNGIGFNVTHDDKIFGVFNRLVNDEYEGSGIGLAIAKRVVEKHNGSIWAKSELNRGATFYFTLNEKKNE
ncbi:GAF domain-containing protein [Aquimarina sp. U1-2]|uniref:ATP-binding protein n=1 Tax=Aquimarina sp. U1-2 TaxID=2823141 RepID=UPI001AECBB46|nr:ATP-binding protein [Aquimarina sp. U1-2]MBP2830700.1 GAF domain-containing protein [Aquimarina sp. U1-2]